MQELKEVVDMGIRGELKETNEEIVLFSAVNIYKWIKVYLLGIKRELNKKLQIARAEVTIDPMEIERQRKLSNKIVISDIVKTFNTFKDTGEFILENFASVIYDKLNQLKILSLSNEEKKQLYEEAEKIMTLQTNITSKSNSSLNGLMRKTLKEIEKGDVLIKIKAKELAIKRYLEGIIKEGIDLGKLINQSIK